MPKQPFAILFDERVYEHFEAIERKYDTLIESEIKTQLLYEPGRETRNRKVLRPHNSFGATWELRCGPNNRFRILYAIDADARQVIVLALLTKIGNRWYIGKEQIEL